MTWLLSPVSGVTEYVVPVSELRTPAPMVALGDSQQIPIKPLQHTEPTVQCSQSEERDYC